MYAIVGVSEIDPNRADEATAALTNGILPAISQAPGFVNATFARTPDGSGGRSMVLFETEEAANAVVANVSNIMPADSPINVVSLDVCEVTASG